MAAGALLVSGAAPLDGQATEGPPPATPVLAEQAPADPLTGGAPALQVAVASASGGEPAPATARSATPTTESPSPPSSAPPAPSTAPPAPGPEPAPAPEPLPAPRATGEWRPLRVNPGGAPVQYDGCRTTPYVTRLAAGPSFARSELEWAIGQIEQASGLDLAWQGDVTEPVTSAWPTDGPLHLGFATAEEFSMPDGTSGYGDSWTADNGDGTRRYTGGRMVLRPDHGWTEGTASVNPLGLMFLHELGHVVGLAHVRSASEVMTDRGNGTARAVGPGDRAGLAAVGRHGACG